MFGEGFLYVNNNLATTLERNMNIIQLRTYPLRVKTVHCRNTVHWTVASSSNWVCMKTLRNIPRYNSLHCETIMTTQGKAAHKYTKKCLPSSTWCNTLIRHPNRAMCYKYIRYSWALLTRIIWWSCFIRAKHTITSLFFCSVVLSDVFSSWCRGCSSWRRTIRKRQQTVLMKGVAGIFF